MFTNTLRHIWKIGLCLFLLISSTTLKAELVFSTAPWGTEENEKAMFEPVAQAMSKWLNTTVVYQSNSNFTTYASNMRRGKYDLVLDGAQFTAWRIKRLKHEPLVTLPERLEFLAVTNSKSVKNLDALIGKPVCGQAPPQLGTLLLWSRFRIDREPVLQVINGETQVFEDLMSGKCSTAILRNNVYAKMSDADKARMRVIYTSRSVPNAGLSAGPNVTKAQRRILIEKMTDPTSVAVFNRFFELKAKSATQFIAADAKDYNGLEVLMDSISYW